MRIVIALGLVLVACGGAVEDVPHGCDVGDRVAPCDDSVTVISAADGGTVGNTCSLVGCVVGDRCVAFVDGHPSQGVCR